MLAFALFGAGVVGQGLPVWALVLFALLWYGAEVAFIARRGWPAGWRTAAAISVRDLLLPLIWLAGLKRAPLDWQGNTVSQLVPEAASTQ